MNPTTEQMVKAVAVGIFLGICVILFYNLIGW